jgi:hypothetical protein
LEDFIGHTGARLARQHNIPETLTTAIRVGSRTETVRPHRIIFADAVGTQPALLVMADTSPHVGRGRGRTTYARFLELLRGTGHRLGLLTNGLQVRLIYAGLDFESWCEWETDRWFDDGEGTGELLGLRQLISPQALAPTKSGSPGLLDAIEESRKRQADLSSVLRENVRQAVEYLLEEVSAATLTIGMPLHQAITSLTTAKAHENEMDMKPPGDGKELKCFELADGRLVSLIAYKGVVIEISVCADADKPKAERTWKKVLAVSF